MNKSNYMAGRTYAERDYNLQLMGFTNYAEYLSSQKWKDIRKQFHNSHGYECTICQARGIIAHHRRYDVNTLNGNTFAHLVVLCHKCHEAIEVFPTGVKRTMREADRELIRLRAPLPRPPKHPYKPKQPKRKNKYHNKHHANQPLKLTRRELAQIQKEFGKPTKQHSYHEVELTPEQIESIAMAHGKILVFIDPYSGKEYPIKL